MASLQTNAKKEGAPQDVVTEEQAIIPNNKDGDKGGAKETRKRADSASNKGGATRKPRTMTSKKK